MDCSQRLEYQCTDTKRHGGIKKNNINNNCNSSSNNTCSSIKTRENTKRNNVASLLSQTSTDWQVDKLTKEVTSLALQLDESLTYVRRNNNE